MIEGILYLLLFLWLLNILFWLTLGILTVNDNVFNKLKINYYVWKTVIILCIFGPIISLFLIKSKKMLTIVILYIYQKLTFGIGKYSNGVMEFTGVILFGHLIGVSIGLSGFPNESFCCFNIYSDKDSFLPIIYRISGIGLSKYEVPGCLPNPKKIKKYKSKNKIL